MIFSEADKGGKGGGAAVAEPPAVKPHAGDATSKSIFNQARVDVGLDQPPAPPVVEPPPPSAKKADEPPAPPAKSKIPDDVIDPDKKPDPKVHDAVAEIQAMVLPKNAKPEQIASFSTLKTKAAEHLQKALDDAAELKKQLESAATPAAEMEGLRKQLAEATERATGIEERWSKEAYASSPQFREKFSGRKQTAIDLAKSYLDGTEIKADIIDLAAHATGRKRVEILKDAGVDDATIQLVAPHLANYDTVQREEATALENWKVTSKHEREAAQQQNEKAKAERTEQENKVWDTIVPKLDLLPFRKSKDNPEWNDRADQLMAEAKRLYNGEGTDLPTFAQTIAQGVAYTAQQEVIDHLRESVTNLTAENTKLKSAAPGGSISSGTQDGAAPDTTKMSREEVSKQIFNSELTKAKGG